MYYMCADLDTPIYDTLLSEKQSEVLTTVQHHAKYVYPKMCGFTMDDSASDGLATVEANTNLLSSPTSMAYQVRKKEKKGNHFEILLRVFFSFYLFFSMPVINPNPI